MKLDRVQKTAFICLIIYLFFLALIFLCFDLIFSSETTGFIVIGVACALQFILHLIILIPMLIKQERDEARNNNGLCL